MPPGRYTQRLAAGLVTDAVGLAVEGRRPLLTKPVQAGLALATYLFNGSPWIVTARQRVGSVPKRRYKKMTVISNS